MGKLDSSKKRSEGRRGVKGRTRQGVWGSWSFTDSKGKGKRVLHRRDRARGTAKGKRTTQGMLRMTWSIK